MFMFCVYQLCGFVFMNYVVLCPLFTNLIKISPFITLIVCFCHVFEIWHFYLFFQCVHKLCGFVSTNYVVLFFINYVILCPLFKSVWNLTRLHIYCSLSFNDCVYELWAFVSTNYVVLCLLSMWFWVYFSWVYHIWFCYIDFYISF